MIPIDPLVEKAIAAPERYFVVWDEPNLYGGNARMDCPIECAIQYNDMIWPGVKAFTRSEALDGFLVSHYAWIEEKNDERGR